MVGIYDDMLKNVICMSFVFNINKANIEVHEEFSTVGGSFVVSTMTML